MNNLKFRQLHLDFHTGETFPDVGRDFSKRQFREILELGRIRSVNLFAKCHHGCFYYRDSRFFVHPNLRRDLLSEQAEVCDEIGVDYYLYLSAGFDEYHAKLHPEWRVRGLGDRGTDESARFHLLCLNQDDYLDVLEAQIAEAIGRFPTAKGVFIDITGERECFCDKCLAE